MDIYICGSNVYSSERMIKGVNIHLFLFHLRTNNIQEAKKILFMTPYVTWVTILIICNFNYVNIIIKIYMWFELISNFYFGSIH